MARLSSLADIEQLYDERGGLAYGEDVTQLEHALQCATLAEIAGSSPSLIVAALLHDIGHLFAEEAEVAAGEHDDRRETRGARALAGMFSEEVVAPIALHVAAKRYLCFTDPAYGDTLSAASRRSLLLQGGMMDATGAGIFERKPYWQDAVMLRRFDDSGKVEQAATPHFPDFSAVMRSLLLRPFTR